MIAAAVCLVFAGLVVLVALAIVFPFGAPGLVLVAALAVAALASGGDRR
jgi:hypothetical protein